MSPQSIWPRLPVIEIGPYFPSVGFQRSGPSAGSPAADVVGFEFFSVDFGIGVDDVGFPLDVYGWLVRGGLEGVDRLIELLLAHEAPWSGQVAEDADSDMLG